VREFFDKAQADAQQAIVLALELPEGHLALAFYLETGSLDFTRSIEEYERALALAPGNAQVLRLYGPFAVTMGRAEAGIAAARRAVVLDPLNPRSRSQLGEGLYWARRYEEAVMAFGEAINLEPDFTRAYGFRGLAYYGLGNLHSARSSCESRPDHWTTRWCLELVYDKLGLHGDAEALIREWQADTGDASAYQFAAVYAQWGNTAKALEWLGIAVRVRDPGLGYLKTDPLMDPLRKDPRFQAVMRELRFPD
jgi:tetratricopeptide (TPR) repeat protein